MMKGEKVHQIFLGEKRQSSLGKGLECRDTQEDVKEELGRNPHFVGDEAEGTRSQSNDERERHVEKPENKHDFLGQNHENQKKNLMRRV